MTKEEFNETEKLYHYTTFESGLKIIASKKLLFGKLKDMNDINESYRGIFYEEGISEDDVKKELSKYRQCSLTMDSTTRKGFNISAMWGHYAEKGYGICLVFDKKKILSTLTADIHHNKINYDDSYDKNIVVDNQDIKKFFEENTDPLFFTKTSDWSYEQEYRILKKTEEDTPTYLDVNNSIMAIILYSAKDIDRDKPIIGSINYDIISRVAPNISILEYGYGLENIVLIENEDGVPTDWLAETFEIDTTPL